MKVTLTEGSVSTINLRDITPGTLFLIDGELTLRTDADSWHGPVPLAVRLRDGMVWILESINGYAPFKGSATICNEVKP